MAGPSTEMRRERERDSRLAISMNEKLIEEIKDLYDELAELAIAAHIYGDDINTEDRVVSAMIDEKLHQLNRFNHKTELYQT